MANEYLSGDLLASLNETVINQAFDIARKNRTGILSTIGMNMSRPATEGYKLSWLDGYSGAAGTTAAAASLAAALTLTVATGDGATFRAGMLVSVAASDEVIYVASVTGDVLTIERGFGGTTAEDIADGAKVTIDSVGRKENSTAENDTIWSPETTENYFQTIDTALSFSRRALATMQYGDTNDMAFQVAEQMRQLTIKMDRALIRGRKATHGTGDDLISYTGGLRYYLDQSGAIATDNSGAALTLAAIQNLNAKIVEAGGTADYIAVGIAKARELNTLVSANYSGQRLADFVADEGAVMQLPSDLPLVGNVTKIVVDTNLNDDELIIYDSSKISIVPMAANNANTDGNWRTLDATQPAQDGQAVRVLGDFGMQIRQSKANMARLYNIA
jgi:hypothetical protein